MTIREELEARERDTLAPQAGDPAPRHMLRQNGYLSSETLAVEQNRPATNRGNGYLQPLALTNFDAAKNGIFPNWDCNNTGVGEVPAHDQANPNSASVGKAPCWVAPNFPSEFGGKHAPMIFADP